MNRIDFINKLCEIKNLDDEKFKDAVSALLETNHILSDSIAPKIDFTEYNKYGFVKTKAMQCLCPVCDNILNAGPNYQPKRCNSCGQEIDFSDIEWIPEEFIEYVHEKVPGIEQSLTGTDN